MTLDLAIRLTEILLAIAFFQQSLEHMTGPKGERLLFLPRLFLSLLLMVGFYTPWVCAALVILSILILKRFEGPYNGGSDRMGLLVLFCLALVHVMPSVKWQEYVFAYLALQLILSYVMAGWVKIINPAWRNGSALQDVFRFSAYPASESIRGWGENPRLLYAMSWAVMLFELFFPLSLLNQTTLVIGLAIAATFHLANAGLFGLNRFFWVWLAAYPSIVWLQDRL